MRESAIVQLFHASLSYLLTKNKPIFRVQEKVLIQRLRMDRLLDAKSRQGSRARKQIEICGEIAFRLGYLTRPVRKTASGFVFYLNPHRCSRVAEGIPEETTGDDLGRGTAY